VRCGTFRRAASISCSRNKLIRAVGAHRFE
jgi:hypothetical protein